MASNTIDSLDEILAKFRVVLIDNCLKRESFASMMNENDEAQHEAKQVINQLINEEAIKELESWVKASSILDLKDNGGNSREQISIIPTSFIKERLAELRSDNG